MRELRYEHRGANTYLVYTVGTDDVIDSMSLGMLTNNEIDGIIPTLFSQMDDTKQILFNVSGRTSAAQLLKAPISKKRLIGILSGVVVALLSAEEYMLEPQSILLGLDYIYVDMKTAEAAVVCLPLENLPNNNQNLKGFFKDIVYQAQFDQSEGYDHIAQILNFINGSSDLSLDSFKSLLANLGGGVQPVKTDKPIHDDGRNGKRGVIEHKPPVKDVPSPRDDNMVVPVPVPAPEEELTDDEPEISLYELLSKFNSERLAKYKAQQKRKKQQKQKGKETPKASKKEDEGSDFGFAVPGYEEQIPKNKPAEPVYVPATEQVPVQAEIPDTGETELLVKPVSGSGEAPQAYLVRVKNNEKIMITGSSFVIGKKRSEVDYCITENKTVSRVHAVISYHNDEFFVTDVQSTNFTYVNGVKIPADEETILAHGTRLSFSDEEFEFCLV